jgi:tetratricopeptide (TPR) repeat protein
MNRKLDLDHSLQPAMGKGTLQAPSSLGPSTLAQVLLLAVLAFVPYANTLRNGFVYDDNTQVLNNPYIQNARHLREIFTTSVWSYAGDFRGTSNYYRPVMTLGYLVCYQIFGPHPFGFHLANVLLNVGVVCILFFLTRRLFRSSAMGFVAAALFALHPIHTEAVDWIAAVTELQLAFFYLLTFWLFLNLDRANRLGSVAIQFGMAGSFVAALLSKEQAITLPVLATVYGHVYREDRGSTPWLRRFSRYGSLWSLAFAYLIIRSRLLGGLAPRSTKLFFGAFELFVSALSLVGQYFWKLLWPLKLCGYYVFSNEIGAHLVGALGGFAALAACAVLFVILWRTARPASFGPPWILVTLAPVLNARWMAGNVFTERYLYLPSVGFCWVVAWGAVKAWEAQNARQAVQRLALAAAALLLAMLSLIRIVIRNRDWKDDTTFCRSTLAMSPEAFLIRNNLGVIYWNQGETKAAEQEWRKAYELAPEHELILHNLGLAALQEKRYDEAVGYFQRALAVRADYADAHLDLGRTYREMGQLDDAELQLRAATALSPLSVRGHNTLGELYFDERRLNEAEKEFHLSIESEPTREGYWDLGFVYWMKRQTGPAEQAFKKAEALDPSGTRVHSILGLFYAEAGRTREAVRQYQEVLRIDPGNSDALTALKKLESQNAKH